MSPSQPTDAESTQPTKAKTKSKESAPPASDSTRSEIQIHGLTLKLNERISARIMRGSAIVNGTLEKILENELRLRVGKNAVYYVPFDDIWVEGIEIIRSKPAYSLTPKSNPNVTVKKKKKRRKRKKK